MAFAFNVYIFYFCFAGDLSLHRTAGLGKSKDVFYSDARPFTAESARVLAAEC